MLATCASISYAAGEGPPLLLLAFAAQAGSTAPLLSDEGSAPGTASDATLLSLPVPSNFPHSESSQTLRGCNSAPPHPQAASAAPAETTRGCARSAVPLSTRLIGNSTRRSATPLSSSSKARSSLALGADVRLAEGEGVGVGVGEDESVCVELGEGGAVPLGSALSEGSAELLGVRDAGDAVATGGAVAAAVLEAEDEGD